MPQITWALSYKKMKNIIAYCYQCDEATLFVCDETTLLKEFDPYESFHCSPCGFRIRGNLCLEIAKEIKGLCPEERRKIWEDFSGERGREGKNPRRRGR